jgi:hypothetical protein
MLAIIMEHPKSHGQLEGIVPHLVDSVLSIFQYSNDTILFMKHDLEKVRRNLKFILSAFEKLQVWK